MVANKQLHDFKFVLNQKAVKPEQQAEKNKETETRDRIANKCYMILY